MKFKTQLIIVFLLAAITRLLHLYYYPVRLTDYHLIQTAADNLTNGYGMGFQRSSVEDLSLFYFEGLRLWPPLVTVITAYINQITGNRFLTDVILLSLSMLGLLWILYKIAKTINLHTSWIIVLFLFLAFNPEVIKHPGFSDVISAFFCLWSILVTAEWIKSDTEKNYLQIILTSLLLFLPSAFRYQYYTLSVFLPIAIVTYAIHSKNKKMLNAGLVCLSLTLSFLLLQEILLYWYTKQKVTIFIEKDTKGIYPGNLTEIYPFFLKTFLNTSYIENTWQTFLLHIRKSYLLFSFLLLCGWSCLLIRKTNSIIKKKAKIILLLLSILVFLFFTLAALSVTHESQLHANGKWTYVMEGRYYIVPSLLILLLTIWMLQEYQQNFTRNKRNAVVVLLTLSLLYNGLLTCKFYYNIATRNLPAQKKKPENERELIGHFFYQQATKSNIPLVISTEDPSIGFYPYHQNIAVTETLQAIGRKQLKTSHIVRLYVVIAQQKSHNKKNVLLPATATKELETANYLIYSLKVEPDQPVQLSP